MPTCSTLNDVWSHKRPSLQVVTRDKSVMQVKCTQRSVPAVHLRIDDNRLKDIILRSSLCF